MDSDDEVLTKKVKLSKSKLKSDSADDQIKQDVDTTKKKPRIKITLRLKDEGSQRTESKEAKKEKKKSTKRSRDDEEEDGDNIVDADIDSEPIPKKRKKDPSQAKKKSSRTSEPIHSEDAQLPVVGTDDDSPIFLNLNYWKQCRESLDGTFKAARKSLTKFDGWSLPVGIPDDKFTDIANITIEKMNK
jgi:hypothetical protein